MDGSVDALTLSFSDGSLIVEGGLPSEYGDVFGYDERIGAHRTLAGHYREVRSRLKGSHFKINNGIEPFESVDLDHISPIDLRDYQREAIESWRRSGGRGLVVLPTGSGKTRLALEVIRRTAKKTLIVVPTLDLMAQWQQNLIDLLEVKGGCWGGGEHLTAGITVSTYDSALIHMEREGGQFALIVFDECHHLPGERYRWIAQTAVAPYRLGLSATPEGNDHSLGILNRWVGPEVYRKGVRELEGQHLSRYEVKVVEVQLEEKEQEQYNQLGRVFRDFLRTHGEGSVMEFREILAMAAKSAEGREAVAAWREQKRILRESQSKLRHLWEILLRHREERVLVFTADNYTAYSIGQRFSLPVITHQTPVEERRLFLQAFREGRWPRLVTSRVLNEGVDVPEVGVGVILSGSGGVREHVQRLGRLLRKREGKKATLYELISRGTSEVGQGHRRRLHEAYGA